MALAAVGRELDESITTALTTNHPASAVAHDFAAPIGLTMSLIWFSSRYWLKAIHCDCHGEQAAPMDRGQLDEPGDTVNSTQK